MSQLQDAIHIVEAKKVDIAEAWVMIPEVLEIFKKYGIGPIKFKEGFGIPVIDFFIDVVKGEQQVGDCPVMSKLVAYLLSKQITPSDVFLICMGFRRKLIATLFDVSQTRSNMAPIMEEVADLFNANLAGVLDIFGNAYEKQRLQLENMSSQERKLKQILKIINVAKAKIMIVQNGRLILANQPFFDAVGVKNVNEVQEQYARHWNFFQHVDMRSDLLEAGDVESWIENVYKSHRPCKVTLFHHQLQQQVTLSAHITTLPESDPLQYVITLHDITSHLEAFSENRRDYDVDPLTGIFNHIGFEQAIEQRRKEEAERSGTHALMILALDALKATNLKEGREAGDRLVIETMEILKEHLPDDHLFGRIDGDMFAVFWPCESEQAAYEWVREQQLIFAHEKHNVSFALTCCDPKERAKKLIVRGYDLIESQKEEDSAGIMTDCKGVERGDDLLSEREKITDELMALGTCETMLLFDELPVTANAELVSMDKKGVTLALQKKQLDIVKAGQMIYLKIPSLGAVKAEIDNVELSAKQVHLGRLCLDRHSPLQRRQIRVTATPGLRGSLITPSTQFQGMLLNMNERFIALNVPEPKGLNAGKNLKLFTMIQYADTIEPFNVNAVVQRIEPSKKGAIVVVDCQMNSSEAKVLKEYIAHRQMETIQKMKARQEP